MSNYYAGKLIKQLRTQKGISQEKLAEGIVTQANLSRMENGKQVCDKEIMEALLERLGFNPTLSFNNYYYNEKDFKIQQKIKELEELLKLKKVESIDKVIKELEEDIDFKKSLNRQFLIIAKAANIINKKGDLDFAKKLVMEALKISIPSFQEKDIDKYLLSNYELKAINLLSVIYINKGESDKSIELLLKLKNSLEKNSVDDMQLGKNLPIIIYNLTRELGLTKRYDEAVELSNIGIKSCIKSNNLNMLPWIVLNKGCCLYEIGDMETSKRLLLQAYYCFDMTENFVSKEKVKNYIKEKFDIVLG